MTVYRLLPLIFVCLLIFSGSASGQDPSSVFAPDRTLFVPHAAVDSSTGDMLIISNAWRNIQRNLRRFHPDGTAEPGFFLQRYDSCCSIQPSLVALGSDGSIFTLEYADILGGFHIFKHAPSGELDVDWGQKEGEPESTDPDSPDENEPDEDESGGGYEEGETTLDWNAGGGRLEYFFNDPVDIVPRSDGSLLVLDRVQRYVFLVSPDGREISEFIGKQDYIPIRPQKLLIDSQEYLYLVDTYDEYDINRENMVGVFRFNPDGTRQPGWGEWTSGINDPWRPKLDFNTLVIDGSDNLIALGSDSDDANHSQVFVFDAINGIQILRDNVQYRQGYDSSLLGILGRPDSGFIVLDSLDFEIQVSYYSIDGVREEYVRINHLYSAG